MREIKMKIRNISYFAVTCFLTVGLFIMMAVPLYEVSYGVVISENDYSLARGVSHVFSGQRYSSVKRESVLKRKSVKNEKNNIGTCT